MKNLVIYIVIMLGSLFYFGTQARTVTEGDSLALVVLYNSTDGPNWKTKWDLNQPVTTWHGVTISDRRVTELDLPHNNLVGSLPVRFGQLDTLNVLSLFNNKIDRFPQSAADGLKGLEYAVLGFNKLDSIPNFTRLPKIKRIEVEHNRLHFDDLIKNRAILARLSRRIFHSVNELVIKQLNVTPNQDYNYQGSSSIRMSVNVRGGNNKYQWYLAHEPLKNDTLPVFTLNNPSSADAGTYFCVITNPQFDFSIQSGIHTIVPDQINRQDSLALVALYNATDGANWTNTWDLSTPVYKWHGISFKDDKIYDLDLRTNNLNGTLPDELGDLNDLRYLNLTSNKISGNIPSSIGNLTNLVEIYLHDNQLTGGIPNTIGNLSILKIIVLENNQLTGGIPKEISLLTSLEYLDLDDNPLGGEIPKGIGRLKNLELFSVFNNQLLGAIPEEIGMLTNLIYLNVGKNRLTGAIPKEIGLLKKAAEIYMAANQLTGGITDSITNIDSLKILDLRGNRLTSAPDFSKMDNLKDLRLNNNYIHINDILPSGSKFKLNRNNNRRGEDIIQYVQDPTFHKVNIGDTITLTLPNIPPPTGGRYQYWWHKNSNGITGDPFDLICPLDGSFPGIAPGRCPGRAEVDEHTIKGIKDSNLAYYTTYYRHVFSPTGNFSKSLIVSFMVHVNIVDTIFSSPTDIMLSSTEILEKSPLNTAVGYLYTTDSDNGSHEKGHIGDIHTYTLSGTDAASFKIEGNQLQSDTPLNFATKPSYSIRITSTDITGLTFTKDFTITVIGNKNPTDIQLSRNSIEENKAVGTLIGNLSTTDPDTDDAHTYTLSGTDAASFKIIGDQLQNDRVLNFETKSIYNIKITTTDNGALTFTNDFTIRVTNINEAPTNIELSGTSIAENKMVSTLIGNITTTDPDAVDTHTYTLSGTDAASFKIQGSQLQNRAVFDFETKSSYSIAITSKDAGGLTFAKDFTITVTDVDETPTALPEGQLGNAINAVLTYPNPSSGLIKMAGLDKVRELEIQVINLRGQVVKTFREVQTSYDLTDLAKGTYILRIQADGETQRLTFILN